MKDDVVIAEVELISIDSETKPFRFLGFKLDISNTMVESVVVHSLYGLLACEETGDFLQISSDSGP